MTTIGGRLREERERLGVNQTDFASHGGVGRKSQFNYEDGGRMPDAAYLAAIAELGADVLYIVTGERSAHALLDNERLMLERYRACPPTLRDAALRVLEPKNAPLQTM